MRRPVAGVQGSETRPGASTPAAVPRVVACCGGMIAVAGLERMTFEVLRVLRQRGVPVHCIVSSWSNERIVALATEIDASWSVGRYWYRVGAEVRNPVVLLKVLWDIARTSAGLLRDARRFGATHVLVPEPKSVMRNAPALAWLRWTGVRVVLRLGNAPEPGRFYRRVWRWLVDPFVDELVCNSEFTRAELLRHGIAERKVRRIYNRLPWRAEPEGPPVTRDTAKIVYVGQIIPAKGLDLLLDAVGVLVARGRDVRLDVVGPVDGWVVPAYREYRDRLLARASAPDLRHRVRFLGYRDDVSRLLEGAAVHCCPSRPEIREGFGLVVLEAKAAGLPSVIFRTGALTELVEHGRDGFICEEVSAEALAGGLLHFLADPEACARAGRAARSSLSPFDPERFAESWSAVFGLGAASAG
jgi:glycosyltransferase involved in cell wall biosynthesis